MARNTSSAPVVLVVEDDWLVRLATAEAFRSQGWVTLEFASAEEAEGYLAADDGDADVVFTDIQLVLPSPMVWRSSRERAPS